MVEVLAVVLFFVPFAVAPLAVPVVSKLVEKVTAEPPTCGGGAG